MSSGLFSDLLPNKEHDDEYENPFRTNPSGPAVGAAPANPFRTQPAQDVNPFRQPVENEAPTGLSDALIGGVKRTGSSLGTAFNVLTNDEQDVRGYTDYAGSIAQTQQQQAFMGEIQRGIVERGDDSLWQGVKNVASAVWEEPVGAMHEMVAQLPNSAVIIGGMAAGAKVGAVAGTAVAPGPGTVVGAIVGGITGLFIGNSAIETGFIAQEQVNEGDYDRDLALKQGAIKGGVITSIDTATLGANRYLFGAGGRAVAKAIEGGQVDTVAQKAAAEAVEKVAAKYGIDPTDNRALITAMAGNRELVSEIRDQGTKAYWAALPKSQKALMGATGIGLESFGEGAGEYLGSMAAGLDASFTEAVMEAAMSLPQSAFEAGASASLAKYRDYTGGDKGDPGAPPPQAPSVDPVVDRQPVDMQPGTTDLSRPISLSDLGVQQDPAAPAVDPAQTIDPSILVPNWTTDLGATPEPVSALDSARSSVRDLVAQRQSQAPGALADDFQPKMQAMRERLDRLRQEREARKADPYTIDFEPTPVPSPLDLAGTSLGASPGTQADAIPFVQPVEAPNLGIETNRDADRRVARDGRIGDIEQQLGDVKQPEGLSDPRIKRLRHRTELRRLSRATLPQTDSKTLNPATDDLMTAIAKAGGISAAEAEAQGIDPAHFRDKLGVNNPFRKDGRSFDAMAEHLAQYGYVMGEQGANSLLEQIDNSLAGNPVYSQGVDMDALQLLDSLRLVEGVTPAQAQKAIQKAMRGEKLGVGQARVVEAALDQITGERNQQASYVRQQLQKARDLRALAMRGLDEQTIARESAIAGEKFVEEAYNPEWTGEERTIYELLHDAESAGVELDALEAIKGLPRARDQAVILYELINEARANEQAARTQEADPAGEVQRGHGEGVQATAAQPADQTGPVDLFGPAPVREQAMADAVRRTDERLRGTGDTPAAESFGDLLSPGRAQQTDIQAPADAGVSVSGVDAAASQADTTAKAAGAEQAAEATKIDVDEVSIDTMKSWIDQGLKVGTKAGWSIFRDDARGGFVLMRRIMERNEAGGGYVSAKWASLFPTREGAEGWAVAQQESAKQQKKQDTEQAAKPTTAPKADQATQTTEIPADLTVQLKAIREATGEQITIEENARTALSEVDSRLAQLQKLLDCVKGK